MQQIITIYDFLLLPVYLFIFCLIVRKKAKKYQNIGLKKIFIAAFVFRMIGSIGYSLLIYYYYGYGDSLGFYGGGNVISDMIKEDITSIKYLFAPAKDIITAAKLMGLGDGIPLSMSNDSNLIIMKLSAIFSFFTFNKYMIIGLCFGFLSFIGIWKLFYVFYCLNKGKNIRQLSFFILFFPSLWFWGSGLLKEPICVWTLGVIVFLFHKNFIEKKFLLRDIFIMLVMLFILTAVKSYITAVLLISVLIILLYKYFGIIKNTLFRIAAALLFIFLLLTVLISLDLSAYVTSFVENSFGKIQMMQQSYQSVKSESSEDGTMNINLSKLNPSLESILAGSPAAIGTCLFRPFIWESKKLIIVIASLETLLVLMLTLFVVFKTKFLWFFKYIFTDSVMLFCFIFSILFALVVGYTTFNFGTLIRYRIIFLPFYFFLLISIYRKYKAFHSV